MSPLPLPTALLEQAFSLLRPAFLIDRWSLEQRVRKLLDAWSGGYSFPVKAQPAPEVVAAVARTGCGFDICSPEELEIALSARHGETQPLSFTSPVLSAEFSCRLVESGADVYLSTPEQVLLWSQRHRGHPAGLRVVVEAGGYDAKFGIYRNELGEMLNLLASSGCALTGLHAHGSMTVLGKGNFDIPAITALTESLRLLSPGSGTLTVSLGGGWPFSANINSENDLTLPLQRLCTQMLLPVLGEKGYTPRFVVEPGEIIVGPSGVFAARVAAVREHHSKRIVVLDSPWEIRPKHRDYPVTFWRRAPSGPEQIFTDPAPSVVHGCANTPEDVVADETLLPRPRPGDLAMIHRCGAYLSSLIAPFNSRLPPEVHLVGQPDGSATRQSSRVQPSSSSCRSACAVS